MTPDRWTRAESAEYGQGWRLDGTGDRDVVLAYDPFAGGGQTLGAWTLWVDNVDLGPVDGYLDTAKRYIESDYPGVRA